MAEQEDKPRIVKFNDNEYLYDDLSENALGQLKGIRVAEAEIKHLQVQQALAETARNAYIQALQADLPSEIVPTID
tara:strand:- start:2221 stop:2448 length:228 start_codon:yes stop_codon:yes gene_type:complete